MAAIESYNEAQRHHGKPSRVLENRIGLAYHNLEMYSLAIAHYSKAIAIKDSALDRINRAYSYASNNQCDPAITDAKSALSMEGEGRAGFHTDAEANSLLASCYAYQSNWSAALQHAEAAIATAREHQYPAADIAFMVELRDGVRQAR